ncbi:ribosomal protein S6 kinase-like 1 [Nothoprocta perdicaria]|uniref:ribosomal protein S6 kinase-like 1 n=1 Tax=Nothoprocta perdicaria TaxID=30464 RepID=UPI000E1B5513|nr:ribosomal protein S6 kinase-like 1 [Nothoprocta perdicaria]
MVINTQAARQLRLALERDVSEDYEEAFKHYQNGVDVLLRGVQVDPNKERREAVKRKITQYLKRAEEIFTCHLQRSLGEGSPTDTGYSSLRFRPIRTLSSAVENLRRCKVVGVIDKVQIVQDPATGGTFILKSLPKSHVETRERQTIIPHGVPFMVKLLRYYASEDSIFLHLEHVQGEMLWSHLRSKYRVQQGPSEGPGMLHSTPIPAPRDPGAEQAEGSFRGSDRDCSCAAGTGRTSRGLVGRPDPSAPREEAPASAEPGPGNHFQLLLAPAGSTKAAAGGQGLSAPQALPGAVDCAPAAGAASPSNEQGRLPHPWDSPSRGEGAGAVPQRAAPRRDPGPLAGERPPPVPKTVPGGGHPGQAQLGRAQARLAAPARAQLRAGIALHGSGSPRGEPAWGASAAGGPPAPGRCRSVGARGHGQRAWAVTEEQVRLWAAEILLALEGLHQQGVLCRDLNPRNLLLDAAGHVRLTFFGQWTEVEPRCSSQALEELYSAPEVGGISELTEAADCWSFGSLLYELLTGVPLSQNHPSGIQPHTQLCLPDGLSLAAASLLTQLLQHSPRRRLGSGGGGLAKLKSHSFFSTIQWHQLGG